MTAWPAAAHLAAFLLGTLLWVVGLGVVGAGVLLVQGAEPENLTDLGAGMLGGLSILQAIGMTGLAVALGSRVPAPDDGRPWRALFPFPVAGAWVAGGLLSGLTLWTLPSWLAEQLSAWVEPATLELITRGLTSGPPIERAILITAVAGTAPVLEEVVFRGYVWRVLEVYLDRRTAFAGSTLLFCAYHLDPVQSTALLPTAAVLGWLRLRSGSLTPSIAAHFVNNGLGVLLASEHGEGVPLWVALAGAAATVVVLFGTERAAPVLSP